MNRSRFRWLLRLSVLPILAMIFLLWSMYAGGERSAVIENHSGQAIAELQLTLAGETRTFKQIASQGRVTFPLKGKDNDTLIMKGTFANGELLRAQVGFKALSKNVAGGRVLLLVLPNGGIVVRAPGQR